MRRRGTPGKGRPHAAEATEAAAPEATEAATAAPTPIAGTPTHGYARGRDERETEQAAEGTQEQTETETAQETTVRE